FHLQRNSSVLDLQWPRGGKLRGLDKLFEFSLCRVLWRAHPFENRKHVAAFIIHSRKQHFARAHARRDLYHESPGRALRTDRRQIPESERPGAIVAPGNKGGLHGGLDALVSQPVQQLKRVVGGLGNSPVGQYSKAAIKRLFHNTLLIEHVRE